MTSYCVFNVGERRIGIAMAHVREIIERHLVVPTPVPLTPPFVHGLFNLRGQVFPYLDLSTFVGGQADSGSAPAKAGAKSEERAIVVEHGNFRFATLGRRIDTIEADPTSFEPVADGAVYPALQAEARTEYGSFEIVHLDRLEACLSQSLKLMETQNHQPANPDPKTSHPI